MMTVSANQRKLLSIFLVGAIAVTGMMPTAVQARETWWQNNRQWVIGSSIGVGFSLLLYLVFIKPQINLEIRARKEQRHQVQALISEVRAWLHRLQEQVNAFPFETFTQEADAKIAQVRQLLTQDLSKHRDTLTYDIERVTSEINQLRVERDLMIKALDAQRALLMQVQQFVQSVKDHQGAAFLDNVIAAKKDIECLLGELKGQQELLAQKLTQLSQATHEQNSTLVSQQHLMNNLQVEVNNLDMMVLQRRAQLDEAHRLSQTMDREVDQVQNELRIAQQEYQLVRNDLDASLNKLANYAQSVKSEKNALDSKVQQAHFLIQDVGSRINSLQEEVNRQAVLLTDEVGSSALLPSTGPRYSNKTSSYAKKVERERLPRTQEPSALSAGSDEQVVKSSIDVLRQALGPFSDGSLVGTGYRKAFLKFTRKNHPDKGGKGGVFQAIDGLYKLLVDKRLLERIPSYVPEKIRKELIAATNAARSIMGRIIH